MTAPVQVGEILPEVVAEALARAGPGYADSQTGKVRTAYSTGREPDATLLKAGGNRRASVCPPARPPTRPTASSSWASVP
jgi:hypothetical protein